MFEVSYMIEVEQTLSQGSRQIMYFKEGAFSRLWNFCHTFALFISAAEREERESDGGGRFTFLIV